MWDKSPVQATLHEILGARWGSACSSAHQAPPKRECRGAINADMHLWVSPSEQESQPPAAAAISPSCQLSTSCVCFHAGISFHWMSQSQPLSDCWVQHPDTKDRKTYAANQQQAARDWLQLLQMRAQELLPGGYLVATAATLEDSESFNHLVAMVYQAWREAAKQGAITEQEFKSFAGGHWLRSREEWLAPLHKELKDEFEVLELQEGSTTDPHWVEYSKAGTCDGDEGPRALAEGYAKFMFGVLAGQVTAHLEQRSGGEVEKVLELMRQKFIDDLACSDPVALKLPYVVIVLRRR